MGSIEVSVILPALNECENLLVLVPKLLALKGVSEVIIVDDNSADATRSEWERRSRLSGGRVRYLRNPLRLGLACSILQGIRAARSSHVIVRDSDLNHDLMAVTALIKAAGQGAQLAMASRYAQGRLPIQRWNDLFSVILNRWLKFSVGRISDWTFGYFIVEKSLLSRISLGWVFRGRGEYSIRLYRALLQIPDLRVAEFPTQVNARGAGFGTTRIWRHGFAYLRAWWEKSSPGGKNPPAIPAWALEISEPSVLVQLGLSIRWEDLPAFFAEKKNAGRPFFCLLSPSVHPSAHDPALVVAAALEGGWRPKTAWTAASFRKRPRPALFYQPSHRRHNLLVEFESI